MRARVVRDIAFSVCTPLLLAAVACTPTGSVGQAGGGAELVASKCTMCHPIDRINQASHDRAAWVQTIARMRGKGAVVTDAEAAQIADYLSKSGAGK